MRIALVADLHGNMTAVEALERDLAKRRADKVICLGDLVGKGPDSDLTYDWAIANCDVILGGNWDVGVSQGLFEKDKPYYEQLGEKRMEALRALPMEYELTLSGKRIRLFHGRPTMTELHTIVNDSEVLKQYFEDGRGGKYDVVGYADAHRQALRTLAQGRFFNIGSVGNALGVPVCCYCILEGSAEDAQAALDITFCSLEYDRREAVRRAERMLGVIPRIETFIHEVETGVYSRG